MSKSWRRWEPRTSTLNNSWEPEALIYLFLSGLSVIQNILLHLRSLCISIIPRCVEWITERNW